MPSPHDYIVVRDGQVVQEISALGAAQAKLAVKQPGTLYARVARDDEFGAEIDEMLAEVLAP